MTDAYLVDCADCGYAGGPYTGTRWKTPEEHAQGAAGGHLSQYPSHDVAIDPVPAAVGGAETANWATARYGRSVHEVAADPSETVCGEAIDDGWTYLAARPEDWPVCRFCADDVGGGTTSLTQRLLAMDPEEVGG